MSEGERDAQSAAALGQGQPAVQPEAGAVVQEQSEVQPVPSAPAGYLLLIDPRNAVPCANIRLVRESSVDYFLHKLQRPHAYIHSLHPIVYEPDPNIRACDMTEAERAKQKFRIRNGAHRIITLKKAMNDPDMAHITDSFRVHVLVVPYENEDLRRRMDAMRDNSATDNPLTTNTACDELYAILGIRCLLADELVRHSTEWARLSILEGHQLSEMPRTRFPMLSGDAFEALKNIMRKKCGRNVRALTLDEASTFSYPTLSRLLEGRLPEEMSGTDVTNFITPRVRGDDENAPSVWGSKGAVAWKSVKWNVLLKLLPFGVQLRPPEELESVGGNGIRSVQGADTRLWDTICTVCSKGTALTEIPGCIDFPSMQHAFFTKEAVRRPIFIVFYFCALVRLAKSRLRLAALPTGQEGKRKRKPTPKRESRKTSQQKAGDQIEAIFNQYQRMAELLLGRGALESTDESRLRSLEDLIWPYVIFSPTKLDVEALALPPSANSAATWATPSVRWTYMPDLPMTSAVHPELKLEWSGMSPDQQRMDAERRALAAAIVEDTSNAPMEDIDLKFLGTICTTPTGAAADSEQKLSKRVLRVGLKMHAHQANTALGRYATYITEESDDDDEITPAGSRRRLNETFPDAGDKSQPEAMEVEEAKAAVRSYLDKDLKVRMLNLSFQDFSRSDESRALDGKVWLVLADPPYNIQRLASSEEMKHDALSQAQMNEAADLFERLLAPGGQCYIFCSNDQFSMWQLALGKAGGRGRLVPDQTPELISRKPEYSLTRSGFRFDRCNCVEFAIHAYKRFPTKEATERMKERYGSGVAFGRKKISWASENTMPPYAKHINNYVPPPLSALLKVGDQTLRTSQKSVATLRDIIRLFAPHPDQIIFDAFAGTMSTVIAAVAENRRVLACEVDTVCCTAGARRVYEYGYRRAAKNLVPSISEEHRQLLTGRVPAPEAVDDLPEQDMSLDPEGQAAIDDTDDKMDDAEREDGGEEGADGGDDENGSDET